MLDKDRWSVLRPHPVQTRLMLSTKRYKCVVAGRGSGKTECARRYLVMKMLEQRPWSDPKFLYLAPTDGQARGIAWEPIMKMIPDELIAVDKRGQKLKNENRMEVTLVTGARLKVTGAEKPHRLEGQQYDGIVFDESSDLKPGIFTKNLGPAMTHREAWAWRIGVPKRRGIGAREFKEFYDRGKAGDPLIDSFTWPTSSVVSQEELDSKRQLLSKSDYNEQYEASWETASGMVFPEFSDINVSEQCVYMPSQPIIVGCDFNVSPMSWVLGHYVNKQYRVFDMIYEENMTTKKTLNLLAERYGFHSNGWIFIGDASSRARKTSASASDYIQIENDLRFKHKKLKFPKSNPRIKDRIAVMNAAILNANGQSRLFMHPDCKELIRDMEMLAYEEHSNDIDDSDPLLGHLADALGYVCWQLFPMVLTEKKTNQVTIVR